MTSRLRELSAEIRALEDRLRQGGGPDKAEKQHKQGKLTARERVTGLCDPGARFIELGLLVVPQNSRSPGWSWLALIGVVASYCAAE